MSRVLNQKLADLIMREIKEVKQVLVYPDAVLFNIKDILDVEITPLFVNEEFKGAKKLWLQYSTFETLEMSPSKIEYYNASAGKKITIIFEPPQHIASLTADGIFKFLERVIEEIITKEGRLKYIFRDYAIYYIYEI